MAARVPRHSRELERRDPAAASTANYQEKESFRMISRFMLDTDSVSFAIRGQGQVVERVVQHRAADLCISVVTLAELRYGADLLRSNRLHALIDRFIRPIQVMPLNESCTKVYGAIASELTRRGI